MLSLLNTTFTNTLRQGFTLVGSLLSKLKARSTYFENKACTKNTLEDLNSEGLLEKASIVTTPTAYSDGVLHSVKPSESPYADFTFTRNNIGTRVNASGNIESVGVDLPRIDYLGGSGSWLLEPQTTNTATDSNDFTTGDIFEGSSNPSLTSAILTSAQATSPDGTNNAWKLVDDNDSINGVSGTKYSGTNLLSNNYNTLSLFVKKQGNNDFIQLSNANYGNASDGTTWFDIANGTLGTVDSNHTASIDDYEDGWYRISVTFQAITDLGGQIRIYLATSDGTTNILRDGTNGVYIYGLQAESHATRQYATSYIPTSGSTVTRAEDSALNAGSSDLISSTEGVLYAEIAALNSINNFESIGLSNGGVEERIRFMLNSIENTISVQVTTGGSGVLFRSRAVSDITAFNKLAIKYKQDDYAIWINGVEEHAITSGAVPTLNQLNFSSGSNFNSFKGNVKCVAVFKEALTDQELTALTS